MLELTAMTNDQSPTYIWKFPFQIDDEIVLKMPANSRVLHVEMQGDRPTVWAECDPAQPVVARKFYVCGTGQPLPANASHVATFQMPPYVWHLYEPDLTMKDLVSGLFGITEANE